MDILRRGVRPSDVLMPKAFENAIASVAATGGSTNAVLHLLGMAREAGIPLSIDDFDRISSRTPLLADLKPEENTWLLMLTRPAAYPDREVPG